MPFSASSLSLRWKILLSTSIAITVLLAITGFIVQEHAVRLTGITIQSETRSSLQAYESVWHSRADTLRTVSAVLSRMPDVRTAFRTGDAETIRDTSREIWNRLRHEGGLLLVADPNGAVISAIGVEVADLPAVRAAAARFPEQSSGFTMLGGQLYQIAVTPVYVESSGGPALINVLVAGYAVDTGLARALQEATGGQDFVFLAGRRVVASSTDSPPRRSLGTGHTAARCRRQAGGRTPHPARVRRGAPPYRHAAPGHPADLGGRRSDCAAAHVGTGQPHFAPGRGTRPRRRAHRAWRLQHRRAGFEPG